MFLAIGSYTFPWAVGIPGYDSAETLTAGDIVRIAASKNIRFVQFGDNMPMHRMSQDCLHTLKQEADEYGVRIEVGTKGLNFERMLQYISIAELMQSPFIRIVIDDASYQPEFNQIIEIIKKMLPILRDKGIQLAIENHDRFPSEMLERIILKSDPAHIGICLDTANSIGAGESIRETVSVLAPYIINIHLKDVTFKRVSHKMGFIVEGAEAGKGMIDIPWIIEQLRPYNKCKTALLELWLNPEANLGATLQKEREMADKSIEYLKRILL